MTAITMDTIVSSVVIVMMLLMIISVPSIILTVRGSSKLLKKYTLLRSIDKVEKNDKMPDHIVSEWEAIKSPLGYITLISNEIEKLDALKPALFQAELAVFLSIVLAIFAGFEQNVLILVIVLDVLCVFAVLYGGMYSYAYKKEYMKMLEALNNEEKDGKVDGMYG